jgi:hypothetical protein
MYRLSNLADAFSLRTPMRGIGSEIPFNRDMERQVHAGNAGGSRLQDIVTVPYGKISRDRSERKIFDRGPHQEK